MKRCHGEQQDRKKPGDPNPRKLITLGGLPGSPCSWRLARILSMDRSLLGVLSKASIRINSPIDYA